jgi:rhodanese-related sulfurtransferase
VGHRPHLDGDSAEQVAGAQRQLVRIGIDRPAGAAVGTPGELAAGNELRSYRRATFADLAATSGVATSRTEPVVLDVRRDDERARGQVPGSVHVPLHSLLERLDEVPDTQLWVHCASGFRASIAASLLDRADREVVLIDDEYAAAVKIGLATG